MGLVVSWRYFFPIGLVVHSKTGVCMPERFSRHNFFSWRNPMSSLQKNPINILQVLSQPFLRMVWACHIEFLVSINYTIGVDLEDQEILWHSEAHAWREYPGVWITNWKSILEINSWLKKVEYDEKNYKALISLLEKIAIEKLTFADSFGVSQKKSRGFECGEELFKDNGSFHANYWHCTAYILLKLQRVICRFSCLYCEWLHKGLLWSMEYHGASGKFKPSGNNGVKTCKWNISQFEIISYLVGSHSSH